MSSANHAPRKPLPHFASTITTLAVAGFLTACLAARWTPVYAQDAKQPAKKKDAPRKERLKNPATQVKRPVPAVGSQIDALSLAKKIDEETQKVLTGEKLAVSPRSDDAEFLRRIYLDLAGVIPPAEKVTAFLDSTDPAKRTKAIDELLADPRFGRHLAEMWANLMVPRENNQKKTNTAPLQSWLADHFNKNTPLDKTVFELLTSTGSEKENGAVAYFVGNPTVDKITDNVTRMFLGVQLQCAQCHNHPFTDYKQNEYWGMAAFFTKVKLTGGNAKNAAKKGESVGITEVNGPVKGKKLPDSAKIVPAKFLHGEEPTMTKDQPARPVLAQWLTTPGNPYFARAMVNRSWFQLFGRGIVNPVDDMHDDNEATHDTLLTLLTEQFQASGCDLKYLVRAICNSETYQRTSRPSGNNADDRVLYSHRLVRVMTPEQMFDSFTVALGKAPDNVQPKNGKKGPAATGRDGFVTFFRIEDGADVLEYQIGIPQALRLMNSGQLNNTVQIVNQAMDGAKTPADTIERLFLRTLSRRPTPPEVTRFTTHVSQAANPRIGYGDILWALLNSSEFTMNH